MQQQQQPEWEGFSLLFSIFPHFFVYTPYTLKLLLNKKNIKLLFLFHIEFYLSLFAFHSNNLTSQRS